MQVFDYLHVVGGNHHADVAQRFHFPSRKTSDSNRCGTGLPGHVQSIQHVLGISASAYGKRNIVWLDEIPQLLRKDILVAAIVRPRCHSGNVVSECEYAEPFPSVAVGCALAEIASEM